MEKTKPWAKATALVASLALALALLSAPVAAGIEGNEAHAYTQQEQIVSDGHGTNSAGYLVIHETANPGATAWNHVLYWGRDDTYAVNYVMELDGQTVYHTVPDWALCWHVGNGNYWTVGIELAHATNSADFVNQWQEAVKWTGDYLIKRGWGIDRLLSHHQAAQKWGGSDHTDPDGYFASYGKSWAEFKSAVREYMATGSYSGTVEPGQPTPAQPVAKTASDGPSIHYEGYVPGYGWLGEVTDAGLGSDGYAGIPNHAMTWLTMRVDEGSLRYQVHTVGGGWLDWVYQSNKADTVYGCAGDGTPIDGLRAYYSSDGSTWYQVYYRSQTVERAGYLATVCDDGTTYGGDDFAGMYGEGMDRLQMVVATWWPTIVGD